MACSACHTRCWNAVPRTPGGSTRPWSAPSTRSCRLLGRCAPPRPPSADRLRWPQPVRPAGWVGQPWGGDGVSKGGCWHSGAWWMAHKVVAMPFTVGARRSARTPKLAFEFCAGVAGRRQRRPDVLLPQAAIPVAQQAGGTPARKGIRSGKPPLLGAPHAGGEAGWPCGHPSAVVRYICFIFDSINRLLVKRLQPRRLRFQATAAAGAAVCPCRPSAARLRRVCPAGCWPARSGARAARAGRPR
ncbi:hypothetical protein AcdelDRAFT_2678 [Acidovorax delafieldii 2AN]|uniref:Uncharacterized protein n=1 Tax=Acidovorax delafieldii 2AN TaxID=573060 RepID=C5T6Z8_ACIDE|nr:hypothetical protein AcdelDRAFT_2678 [Acidovorax delafieldii 2AN]